MLEDSEEIYIIDYTNTLPNEVDVDNTKKIIVKKPSEIKELVDSIVNEKLDLDNFDYYLKFYE